MCKIRYTVFKTTHTEESRLVTTNATQMQ